MRKIKRFLALFIIFAFMVTFAPLNTYASNASEEENEKTSYVEASEIIENERNQYEDTLDYILNNLDDNLSKPVKAEKHDVLMVKQTFANKNLMPKDNYTIDGLWEWKGEEKLIGDAFITMNEVAAYMYNTDDESRYFVAYINPLIRDKNITAVDVDFAKISLDGEEYKDCIYDSATGIAYIPKKYTVESGLMFQTQCQVLFLVNSADETCDVSVEVVSDIEKDNLEKTGEIESEITSQATNIKISEEEKIIGVVDKSEIKIYINGDDVPWEDFVYDKNNGVISIPIPPSSIDNIKIEINGVGILGTVINKLKSLTVLNSVVKAATSKFFGSDYFGKAINVAPITVEYSGDIENLKNAVRILKPDDAGIGNMMKYGGTGKLHTDEINNLGGLSVYYPYGSIAGWTESMPPSIDQVMSNPPRERERNLLLYMNYVVNGGQYIPTLNGTKKDVTDNPISSAGQMGAHQYRLILSDPFDAEWNGVKLSITKDRSDPAYQYYCYRDVNTGKSSPSMTEIPMHCAHIITPLGEYSDNGHKIEVAMRIVDIKVDPETGDGEMIIALLSQHSPEFYTEGIKYRQAGVGMLVVKLKRTPEVEIGQGSLKKVDSDTKLGSPQGDATLEGGTFNIELYVEKEFDDGEGGTYTEEVLENTWVKTSSKKGIINFDETLPIGGRLVVTEVIPPRGYNLPVQRKKEVIISGPDLRITFEDPVKRGGVSIEKWDVEFNMFGKKQGDATLKGTEFTIYNDSENSVFVDGYYYRPGEAVKVITTDESGRATTAANTLPFGSYIIRETKEPEGYLFGDYSGTFKITDENSGKITDLTMVPTAGAAKNQVIRGGVKIVKKDKETKNSESMGPGNDLSGIEFTIWNISSNYPAYGNSAIAYDKEVAKRIGSSGDMEHESLVSSPAGGFVTTITTAWDEENKEYSASTGNRDLPYGTYAIAETKVPLGGAYILSDRDVRIFEIRKDSEIVFVKDAFDQIRRNDIEFEKIEDTTSRRLKVAFLLTNLDTGEEHVLVTNENGEAATHIDIGDYDYTKDEADVKFPPHSWNTNGNDGLLKEYGEDNPIPSSKIDTKAGIWFGITEGRVNGTKTKADPDDRLSALTFGHYRLKELRCEENVGLELQEFNFNIYSSKMDSKKQGVDISTVTDDMEKIPAINTRATDIRSGERVFSFTDCNGFLVKNAKIVDTVFYENLRINEEYTIRGNMINLDSGEKIKDKEGQEVISEVRFVPKTTSGSIEVPFVFARGSMENMTILCQEELYKDGKLVAEHKDEDAHEQMISLALEPKGPTANKYVISEDGIISSQQKLYKDEKYGYRMSVTAGGYNVKDIVMTDMIERKGSTVIGSFIGVDTSEARRKGFEPFVYYTTKSKPEETDWSSVIPKDIKDIVGVKVVLRGLLSASDTVYADIMMEAPDNTDALFALNDYTMDYTVVYDDETTEPGEPIVTEETRIDIEIDPRILKDVITKDNILSESAFLVNDENYGYRLNFTAGNQRVKDIVITDMIERSGSDIIGKFIGVDVSDAKKKGFEVNVLYTQSENPRDEDWSKKLPKELDTISGVKFELTGILEPTNTVFVDVLTKVPTEAAEMVAFNEFYADYKKLTIDGDTVSGERIMSNITEVSIEELLTPYMDKLEEPEETEPSDEYEKSPKTGENKLLVHIILLCAGLFVFLTATKAYLGRKKDEP